MTLLDLTPGNPISDKTTVATLNSVFVIDDDPISNLICENLIKRACYASNVKSFLGAKQALAWFATEDRACWPELILLDINMPEINGWAFLGLFEAIAKTQQVRVYILSSSVSQTDLDRASADPRVTGYLVKPLTFESLPLIPSAY